jgi:hypothetical protein
MENSWNFTKKDVINASSSIALQTLKGEKFNITGATIAERPDENGEVRTIGLFKRDDGMILSTISDSVIRNIPMILEYAEESGEASVPVQVNSGKSANGREFITLILL